MRFRKVLAALLMVAGMVVLTPAVAHATTNCPGNYSISWSNFHDGQYNAFTADCNGAGTGHFKAAIYCAQPSGNSVWQYGSTVTMSGTSTASCGIYWYNGTWGVIESP